MEVIKAENLIRNYKRGEGQDEIKVLKGLSFTVEEGEFVGIMGKSGCGKTTLLKVLGMIEFATDGKLFFYGKDIDELYHDRLADIRRKEIGFIFQEFYLMNSLSVEENIILPMILDDAKLPLMKETVKKYSELFEISHLLHKNPQELSGGEKQRVAICRALANDPLLILADEPTGNLDSKSGQIVIDTMVRINKEMNKTIVMVTHDPKMASYCDRVILLKDGVILKELKKEGEQEKFYGEIVEKMGVL